MNENKVINTGGGAYIGGGVNTGGGKFVGRDDKSHEGLFSGEAESIFAALYKQIENVPTLTETDKKDLKTDVEELVRELAKGEKADESYVQRRLRNLRRMAPDILEITVATITNPVAGLGLTAKKIAEKMKTDTK